MQNGATWERATSAQANTEWPPKTRDPPKHKRQGLVMAIRGARQTAPEVGNKRSDAPPRHWSILCLALCLWQSEVSPIHPYPSPIFGLPFTARSDRWVRRDVPLPVPSCPSSEIHDTRINFAPSASIPCRMPPQTITRIPAAHWPGSVLRANPSDEKYAPVGVPDSGRSRPPLLLSPSASSPAYYYGADPSIMCPVPSLDWNRNLFQ